MFENLKNWITENPKKFKIYVVLIGFILLSLLFKLDASASSIVDTLGDPTEYLSDNDKSINDYPYYVICETTDHLYRYIFSTEPIYLDEREDGLYLTVESKDYKSSVCVHYDPSTKTFINFNDKYIGYYIENYTFMIYSNHNIKYLNDESYFFYASPSIGQTYPIIGGNISTQTIFSALAKEILTILPSLLVLMVSFLALRKGLRTILNHLRRG